MWEEVVFPDVDCLNNVGRIGNFAVLLINIRSLNSIFSTLEPYIRNLSIKPDTYNNLYRNMDFAVFWILSVK